MRGLFPRLLRTRAVARVAGPGPEELQLDIGEFDQLFDLAHGHTPNTWQGQDATKMKAGFHPPFPIEPPEDMPRAAQGVVIEVHETFTNPGVGPEDMESMIPDGELGW